MIMVRFVGPIRIVKSMKRYAKSNGDCWAEPAKSDAGKQNECRRLKRIMNTRGISAR